MQQLGGWGPAVGGGAEGGGGGGGGDVEVSAHAAVDEVGDAVRNCEEMNGEPAEKRVNINECTRGDNNAMVITHTHMFFAFFG